MQEYMETTAKTVQSWFDFATHFKVDVRDEPYAEFTRVINHYVPVGHPFPEAWFSGAIDLAKLYGLVPSREADGVAIMGPCEGPRNTLTVYLFLEGSPGSPLETRGSMRVPIRREDEDVWRKTLMQVNQSYTIKV